MTQLWLTKTSSLSICRPNWVWNVSGKYFWVKSWSHVPDEFQNESMSQFQNCFQLLDGQELLWNFNNIITHRLGACFEEKCWVQIRAALRLRVLNQFSSWKLEVIKIEFYFPKFPKIAILWGTKILHKQLIYSFLWPFMSFKTNCNWFWLY